MNRLEIYRRLGIGFLATLATFMVTMGVIQLMITLYRLDIDFPMNKDIFLLLMAGQWVFFYHHMMRLSS